MIGLILLSVLQFLVRISLQSQESNVCPSEYAYQKDSVKKAEPDSANCRNYPNSLANTQFGSEDYIHCDGTQRRLTDSDFGPEQYSSSYYYEWKAETLRTRQLLFIFPTRVNLTTITLHYYSDSQRGLPRLRFIAAPDNFNVWDATPGNSRYADIAAVPQVEESPGRRSVNISVNFTTTRILMIKFGSNYMLSVSEVEFFNLTNENQSTSSSLTPAQVSTTTSSEVIVTTEMTPTYSSHQKNTDQTQERTTLPQERSDNQTTVMASAVTAILLMLLLATSLFILALLCYKRRSHKPHPDTSVDNVDVSYSTLDRGTKKAGLSAPLNDSSELYDQIQLSPCTGQSEVISETKDSPETEKVLECPTYAVVDKKKKKKTPQSKSKEKKSEALQDQQRQNQVNLEEMYAVVNKKPKKKGDKEQEAAPPIPEHTIEALYTAVQK